FQAVRRTNHYTATTQPDFLKSTQLSKSSSVSGRCIPFACQRAYFPFQVSLVEISTSWMIMFRVPRMNLPSEEPQITWRPLTTITASKPCQFTDPSHRI
ncbi:hypothetical protein THAOC_26700, partial [Thalassiosira oceanica]